MGWCGYGLYAGDGTQSCHFDFIRLMKISDNDDEIFEKFMLYNKTKIPKDKQPLLRKNYKLVVDKMPKRFRDEDDALLWQMLLSLYVDNNVKPPKIIFDNGIKATQFLLNDPNHVPEFDKPSARRRCLKAFIERAKKVYGKI